MTDSQAESKLNKSMTDQQDDIDERCGLHVYGQLVIRDITTNTIVLKVQE